MNLKIKIKNQDQMQPPPEIKPSEMGQEKESLKEESSQIGSNWGRY